MKCALRLVLVSVLLPVAATAQDMMADVFAGKLVNPEVGVYAWYNLKDFQSDRTLFLRQAIVGKEKVGDIDGYWLEIQVVPQVGFPTTHKMLLTGPATNPKNVHKLVVKEGMDPPRIVQVDKDAAAEAGETPSKRQSKGFEKIPVPQGALRAEHFVVTNGEDTMDLWLNDTVRPLGVVQMTSKHGELKLTRYGQGGKDGTSVIGAYPPTTPTTSAPTPPTPPTIAENKHDTPTEEEAEKKPSRPKRNFGGKGN